jgi:hypothetical protein
MTNAKQQILNSRGVEKVSLNLPNNNLDYGDEYGQKKTTPFGVVGLWGNKP